MNFKTSVCYTNAINLADVLTEGTPREKKGRGSMKKTLAILLALSMLLVLAACGGSGSSSAPAPSQSAAEPGSTPPPREMTATAKR